MSLSLLCPEAQTMVRNRGIKLTTNDINNLAFKPDHEQTSWLHCPIIAHSMNQVWEQFVTAQQANYKAQLAINEPNKPVEPVKIVEPIKQTTEDDEEEYPMIDLFA